VTLPQKPAQPARVTTVSARPAPKRR
jgi:hypothetical protein